MATSAEIAQQISDQQSWFMQQNAMASQIGVNPAAFGGGLGGWGMGAMAPAMAPHPGMGAMPGAFNYGSSFGFGAGNRMGAFGASGLSMAPALAATGMQVGSMLYGSGMAPLVNPVGAFMMARGAGFGLGASAGLAGASMLPMAAGAHMVGSMVGGMQQQAMVNTAVGNYNFANPMSITGQGFSRQDALSIGQQVRQLAMIPEMMTSFQEISRILPQLRNMGAMSGVRDAAEFNKRLRDSITTMREISRVIGSSMEEAAEFFAHSRRVGFFGRDAQLQNALNARVTGSLTGQNTQQFMAMQQQGASFGSAVGGSRALGTQGVTAIAGRLGAAIQGNAGLQQVIENITGQSGSDAVGAAAGMLQQAGQRIAGTGPGRFLMAGFMRIGENGEVEIDPEMMARQQQGGLGMGEIRRRGSQNMSNRRFVEKFERRQTRLGQQFAAEGGPEALLSLLQGAGISEDGAGYLLQSQFGLTEQQSDLVESLLRDSRSGMGDQRRLVQQIVEQQARRREAGPGGLMKRIGTVVSNKITQPFAKAGAEMHKAAGQFVDEIYEDLMGDVIVRATEQGKKDFLDALAGNKDAALRAFGSGTGVGSSSGTITSGLREMFRDTSVMAAFAGIGTNGTGYTASGERRLLGEMMGVGAQGSDAAFADQLRGFREGRHGFAGGALTDVEKAGARAAKVLSDSMDANDPEYAKASPMRRAQMMTRAIGWRGALGGGGEIGEAYRALSARGGGIDPSMALYMASGSMSEEDAAKIYRGSGAAPIDAASVHAEGRNARSAMERFGAASQEIMKSAGASALLNEYFNGKPRSPEERDALRKAIRNGNVSEVQALTNINGLTAADLTAVTSGLDEYGTHGSGGAAAIRSFIDAGRKENRIGMSQALDSIVKDTNVAASNVGGPLGEMLKGFGNAAADLSQAFLGKGSESVESGLSKLGATVDSIATAIEKMPQSERDSVMKDLPASIRIAVSRRAGVKSGVRKMIGTNQTISEIMKVTGMTEHEISQTLGRRGDLKGSDMINVDSGVADKLSKAAGVRGAGAALLAGGEDLTKKAKEDQQLILMKTMTEALIAIAGDKMPSDVAQAYRRNKDHAEGRAYVGAGGGERPH